MVIYNCKILQLNTGETGVFLQNQKILYQRNIFWKTHATYPSYFNAFFHVEKRAQSYKTLVLYPTVHWQLVPSGPFFAGTLGGFSIKCGIS